MWKKMWEMCKTFVEPGGHPLLCKLPPLFRGGIFLQSYILRITYLKYFIFVLMKSINLSLLSSLNPFISIMLVINLCSVLCNTFPFRKSIPTSRAQAILSIVCKLGVPSPRSILPRKLSVIPAFSASCSIVNSCRFRSFLIFSPSFLMSIIVSPPIKHFIGIDHPF